MFPYMWVTQLSNIPRFGRMWPCDCKKGFDVAEIPIFVLVYVLCFQGPHL